MGFRVRDAYFPLSLNPVCLTRGGGNRAKASRFWLIIANGTLCDNKIAAGESRVQKKSILVKAFWCLNFNAYTSGLVTNNHTSQVN